MSINNIPPDIIRNVAQNLELQDLERLYATFNLRLQQTLSRPNLIHLLRVSTSNMRLQWDRVYFLKAACNIHRLEFPDPLKWRFDFFPLISTLNPIELLLPWHHYDHAFDAELLNPWKTAEQHHASQYWNIVPRTKLVPVVLISLNYKVLTPRLQSLELADTPLRVPLKVLRTYELASTTIELPTSVTSLTLGRGARGNLPLRLMPSTLRFLSLHGHSESIASLFDQFTSLEELRLLYPESLPFWGSDGARTPFPRTLSSFTISTRQLSSVLQFFKQFNFEDSFVSQVTILLEEDERVAEIDFTAILPPSITELRLLNAQEASWREICFEIGSLPPHLTALSLGIGVLNATVLDLMYSLPLLLKLRLESKEKPIDIDDDDSYHSLKLSPSLLPRTMISLYVDESYKLSSSAILGLPPALTSLSVSSMDLKLLSKLHLQCPNCHLTILDPFKLWSKANGPRLRDPKFGMPWTATAHMADWSSYILAKCALESLTLQVSVGSWEWNSSAPAVEHFSLDSSDSSVARLFRFNSYFIDSLMMGLPNLRSLKLKTCIRFGKIHLRSFPPLLTHLDLDDPHLTIDPYSPLKKSSLRIITTTSLLKEGDAPWKLPPNLIHLDAPNWVIAYPTFSQWSLYDFEDLHVHIAGIVDWQIPRMIASKNINAKTRSNMRLLISYGISGLIAGSKGSDKVNWSDLCELTGAWLTSKLNASAPTDASFRYPKGSKPTLRDSILSFTWKDGLTPSSLFFKRSARSITITADAPWQLGAALHEAPPFGVPFALSALKHLKRLVLECPLPGTPILSVLPSGLKHLQIAFKEVPDLGSAFPPSLEVLMIETPRAHHVELSFSLSDLPPSLVHFCISIISFRFRDADSTQETLLNLPKMKSLYLIGLPLEPALMCRKRFPIASIDTVRILVFNPQATYDRRIPPEFWKPTREFQWKAGRHEAATETGIFKDRVSRL